MVYRGNGEIYPACRKRKADGVRRRERAIRKRHEKLARDRKSCGERASASEQRRWSRGGGSKRLGSGGGGEAREGRVKGSLNSGSDRSLCSMRGCVNVRACVYA